ncbi:transport protein Avl9-domain-containing protein, partial [Cerioporus squamosus]
MSTFDHSPEPSPLNTRFLVDPDDDDTIPSHTSPTVTPRPPSPLPCPRRRVHHATRLPWESRKLTSPLLLRLTLVRQSLSLAGLTKRHTMETDASSPRSDVDGDGDDRSFFARNTRKESHRLSSVAPSMHEVEKPLATPLPPSLPPSATLSSRPPSAGVRLKSDTDSTPGVVLVQPTKGPLVLGIALVDFNHLVGPKIDFSRGDIFDDEEISKIFPSSRFLMTTEDYSYFHVVPSSPNPTTIFGISCNRQISSADLLVKGVDVTRSTVQKAVVVLATKPVFGPIRDRLGVITRAL